MKTSLTRQMLAVVVGCSLMAGASQAAVLYDPAAGTLPSQQGWTTQPLLGTFTESVSGGVYHVDSGPANLTSVGSALGGVLAGAPLAALDTAAGFTLDFSLKIVSESHSNANRAGFSVLFTGLDPKHSLELGFWNDRVFAYDFAAPSTFTPGASALFDTSAMRDYSLQVQGNQYTFSSGGTALLQGALVDYTPRGSVYPLSGLLFFGDDTTGAQSSADLGKVSLSLLSPVPEPASAALLIAGLAGLAWRSRRARG